MDEIDKSLSRLDDMVESLIDFSEHKRSCAREREPKSVCDCGLDELLRLIPVEIERITVIRLDSQY